MGRLRLAGLKTDTTVRAPSSPPAVSTQFNLVAPLRVRRARSAAARMDAFPKVNPAIRRKSRLTPPGQGYIVPKWNLNPIKGKESE